MAEEKLVNLDVMQIQEYQRNRFPCLFVDCITEVVPGIYAKGYKNFTYNEWYFPAHFDDEPNVPGFVQFEALAQVFLMTFLTIEQFKGSKTAFIDATNVLFRRKIVPGERLEIEACLKSFRHGVAKGKVSGSVGNEAACSAEYVIAIPDIVRKLRPCSGGIQCKS